MSKRHFLEFEQPIAELESKIDELRYVQNESAVDISEEIDRLSQKSQQLTKDIYASLSPWQVTQIARHPQRPYTLDYVADVFTEFQELHGDRHFADDQSLVGGLARFNGQPCMVIGHQKGRNIHERQYRNFAMAKPEGYRKAMRLMEMANRFDLPVITFVDTPAADPGVESESRGISEALAASMLRMFELEVPTIAVVVGEGGSGGALAIAVANSILMQEHAIYSVIPPEGCAAILWRAPDKGPQASAALKLTAQSALDFGLIDEILPEPKGGAHRDWVESAGIVKEALRRHLADQRASTGPQLKAARYAKFRQMGSFIDPGSEQPALLA